MRKVTLLTILMATLFAIGANAQTAAPVLTTIGAQSTAEGVLLSFGVTATDDDATTPVLTTSALPANASFTDNGNGTGDFSFTPSLAQSGDYDVTFYATDAVTADIDSEIVTITVTNVNQAPVLGAIGAQNVAEGAVLNFGVTATDADATTPTLTTSTLPTNATFTDNLDGTGSFSFSPDFTQAGSIDVTFYASDGTDTDSELVTITVSNTNQEPVLAAIGVQSIAEGATLAFGVSASDADATTPTLTTSALPANASFTDNGNGTGSFSFTPDLTQAGPYSVTFYASDGSATDSEVVAITVTNTNQAPTLATIGAQSVNEGQLLTFGVSATDPDATSPVLTTSALPTNASFVDNGNGTGTFNFTPDFTQAGSINVTFYASDGIATDSEVVAITVTNVNQAPVLAAIGAKSVAEGAVLAFGVTATDADGSTPTLTTSTLPTNATFTDNGNGTGSFSFSPSLAQAGDYSVTFYATDGADTDSEVVAITVTDANQAPVLAAIGSKNTNEGQLLAFSVSATDGDGTTPTLTTSALPANANFTDNGNGTGDFSFTPDFNQAGAYNVTFYATDGSATDSEVVAISVTNVNQSPILAAIGPKNVTEGQNLNFGISATDNDGTTPALTTSALPANASFVDNGNGTGTFDFNPSFTQAGPYSVTFYAADGQATDSEVVTITVNEAGNQSPVLAAIGPKSISEGATLAFGVSATDIDGTTLTLSTSTLPTNASFTDNGNGTGNFSFTPDLTQGGSFNITFYATDGSATDSEVVAITVTEVNQAPVLAAIGAKSTNEGQLLTFGVSATDGDGTSPALTTSALPANATFLDNGNGTGTFSFTPSLTQAGPYSVTFYASDGIATDSEVVAITVNNVNQEPVLAAIGSKSTNEGQLLTFGVSASDPDATTPALTTSALPANATFTDNGNGTGTFNFTPDFTQAGPYNVTFYASDGSATDSEVVAITVTNINQAPVLAAIGPKAVAEGATLAFVVSATDVDGTTPVLSTSALPANATFVDNGNGTGNFSFSPDFLQGGTYNITYYATDGAIIDSEVVVVTVTDAGNQSPILAAIGPKSVTEGQTLNFDISATDPDGSTPTFSTSTLPLNASFVNNGNGTGSFSFSPSFVQAGPYIVTFYASDGSAIDSEQVTITVNEAGNQSPILAAIGNQSVVEGQTLNVPVSASDLDNAVLVLTTSSLPANADFVDAGDGSGTFTFTPSFTQAGAYDVTFYVNDGAAIDSERITITVTEAGNQNPVLAAIGPKSVAEGSPLNFVVSATDADATIPTLTTSALPANATFVDNGDGTGTFDFTPDFTQAGGYTITFYASDSAATDSELVNITVTDGGNQAPVLAAIGPRSVTEGLNLNFGVSATDVDLTVPILTTSSLPANASFVDNGNGTGSFDFSPSFIQSGAYQITFYASDGAATDSEVVTITVDEAGNQDPILAAIGPQNVAEGGSLNLAVTATDVDDISLTLSASPLPLNATFTDNGDGTGNFSFAPGFDQAGTYDVIFKVSDGSAADSEIVLITVTPTNQIPVLTAIGSQTTTENLLLSFGVGATDGDGVTPVLSAANLPLGASFVDNLDGSGSFSWTPSFAQGGSYNVTFYAADGAVPAAIDSEVVTITVNDAGNQPPVLSPIGPRTVGENTTLNFTISASDADGTFPALSASPVPTNASFTDNGDGTGSFSFTPSPTQAGTYNITFRADDGLAADSETVTITVTESGNAIPTITAVPDTSVNEGAQLILTITASDPDGVTPPALSISTPLRNYTFVDNGNGTATFTYSPDYYDAGEDTVRFFASDGSPNLANELAVVTTVDVNRAATFAPVTNKQVAVYDSLKFTVTAADSTDPLWPRRLFLSALNLPIGAQFIDNGNNTGSFKWMPIPSQIGDYNITILATDQGAPALSGSVPVLIKAVSVNRPPVLNLALAEARAVTEGQTLIVNVVATDPDGISPTIGASNMPANATLVQTGPGTAQFVFTPDFLQGGNTGGSKLYTVTITANDGFLSDNSNVTIQVYDAGEQAPVFDSIPNIEVTEGQTAVGRIRAHDPDGKPITLRARLITLPAGATFADSGNGLATITFTPSFNQAGTYSTMVIAEDGTQADTVFVPITVLEAGNQPPVLATIANASVKERAALTIPVTASDPDGDLPLLTAGSLPTGATFTDNTNGTGSFVWVPTNFQAGSYQVMFYAEDRTVSGIFDSQQVTITVVDSNLAPLLLQGGGASVNEGDTLRYVIQASDPDLTVPILHAELSTADTLATNMVFVDSLNGKGVLFFTPNYQQGGTTSLLYNIAFEAVDATDPTLVIRKTATITCVNRNAAPVLTLSSGTGPFTITEGINLSFNVSATDPDGGNLPTVTATNLPPNATFSGGALVKTFSFTPDFTQAGNYSVRFYAQDLAGAIDSEIVAIQVVDAGNQPPTITSTMLDTMNIATKVMTQLVVRASDPEHGQISITANPIVPGATFVDSGNGVAVYTVAPDSTTVGSVWNVEFIITDGLGGTASTHTHLRVVTFLRGDLDQNGKYTVIDLAAIINYLLRSGPAPVTMEAADVNNDDVINLVDLAYLIGYMYAGGPPPPQ